MIKLPDTQDGEALRAVVFNGGDGDRWAIEYRLHGEVRWAKLLPPIDPPMKPVRLSDAQIRYLHYGPSADGEVRPQGDLIIRDYESETGWILVGDPDDEEESGVWVDDEGHEHYGGY